MKNLTEIKKIAFNHFVEYVKEVNADKVSTDGKRNIYIDLESNYEHPEIDSETIEDLKKEFNSDEILVEEDYWYSDNCIDEHFVVNLTIVERV